MRRGTKGTDSEKRILEAAIALIAERGYRDTKISDIVKAAGLTQAAFYLYFPSKEAVYQTMLEKFRARLTEHLQAAVMPPSLAAEQFPERVKRNLEGLFELFQEQPALTKIFLTEENGLAEAENGIREAIISNLMNNQAAGYVRTDVQPRMMANSMIGLLVQVTLTELIAHRRPPRDVAHELTDILLFGLARPERGAQG
ncbi:TetR/AcrR family transcriptional regulator [Paenibacillus nanensis]|uniref:TetR/AcrR family transcriptional regulator n=1 Tax=Paenibacillus nanensis TaxID=393251 RepID=A0A3A1USK1_9BACL|nr:TetR/AcrR family transcriptional regulator [Paenibacillus nanensis]RIX51519.1 TetR/AcrR family transcriptional regulator [Paenibacillus nanensis]